MRPDASDKRRPAYNSRNMSRRIRLLAAFFALAGVLFAQLAVPVHACAADSGWVEMADHACCDSEDGDGAALCQAHCQYGDQSLDIPSSSVSAPAAIAWAAVPDAAVPLPSAIPPSLLARATAPPVALRHCRLRF